MNDMNDKRLKALADFLSNKGEFKNSPVIPDEAFEICLWKCSLPKFNLGDAIGHAAEHPWFNKEGLRLDENYIPVYIKGKFNAKKAASYPRSWDAVTEFFEIDFDDAIHLFDFRDGFQNTKQGIEGRVRRFIKRKRKERRCQAMNQTMPPPKPLKRQLSPNIS